MVRLPMNATIVKQTPSNSKTTTSKACHGRQFYPVYWSRTAIVWVMVWSYFVANFLLVSAQDFLRFIDYCKFVAWLLGPSVLDTFLHLNLVDQWLWSDLWMVPNEATEPIGWITFVSSGFLHSQFDPTHVLGNILIISLVGIPLEQRLGRNRFIGVYFIGLVGGSIAWFLFNIRSSRPALGASGAAFGLFGAYLAGWPKDEIRFH